jgi:hypothetical protein
MDKHGGKPQLQSFSVEEDLEERLSDKEIRRDEGPAILLNLLFWPIKTLAQRP